MAVGADYTSFEGYKDEATGETVIGLSYAKLCQFVQPGNTILMSDGTITITVRAAARACGPGSAKRAPRQPVPGGGQRSGGHLSQSPPLLLSCVWVTRAGD